MTTAHLQIAAALVDLLKVDPPVAARIYRARTSPIPSELVSAVNVELERSASQLAQIIGGRTGWTTLISIECYGRVEGDSSDAAADPVLAAVFERLASDPTLGGLAMSVEPLEGDTLAWGFASLETNMACVTAKFVVKHQTTGRTLTT